MKARRKRGESEEKAKRKRRDSEEVCQWKNKDKSGKDLLTEHVEKGGKVMLRHPLGLSMFEPRADQEL
jgi:hypothetical protein